MKKNVYLEESFLLACRNNDLKKVKDFLHGNYFEEFNNKQLFLNTGLCSSVRSTGIDVTRYLLTSPELHLHADIHENMDRPLRLAVIKPEHIQNVIYLCTGEDLKDKATIEYTKEDVEDRYDPESALANACWEGNLQAVEFFLTDERVRHTCSQFWTDGLGHDCLAIACTKNRLNVIEFLMTSPLLEKRSVLNDNILTLVRTPEVFDYLCFSPDIQTIDLFSKAERLISYFARNEHYEIFKYICEHVDNLKFDYKDSSNYSPFEIACIRKEMKIVQYMLYDINYQPTTFEKEKIKSYHCPTAPSFIDLIEKRDLLFSLGKNLSFKENRSISSKI